MNNVNPDNYIRPDSMLAAFKTALTNASDYSDEVLKLQLNITASAINHKRNNTFALESDLIEKQYKYDLVDISVKLLNRQGAEGETQHVESDINRIYESDAELFNKIIPLVSFIHRR